MEITLQAKIMTKSFSQWRQKDTQIKYD